MGKCDYCKFQKSNGACGFNWLTEIHSRSHYCEKALKKMDGERVKKCNFCEKSTKSGKCDAKWDWDKEKYCEKAIAIMVKAGMG